MSEGMNKCFLLGNLGADPELRSTQGGESVLNIRMAMTERYMDKNKEWQEKTEWANVTVWGKRGEALHKLLSKGSKVMVEGSLRTSSYEKDGQKVWKTEIVARNVLLCGDAKGGQRSEGAPRPAASKGDDPGGGFGDDDFGGL